MQKSKWLILSPLFVLSFGLNSCKKAELPAVETYRISKAEWQSGENIESFTEANRLGSSRKLSDKLILSANPGTLHVESACGVGKEKDWTAEIDFDLPGEISLFSMLPYPIFLPDVLNQKNKVFCSIHFRAANKNGSTHWFHMRKTIVEDNSNVAPGIVRADKADRVIEDDAFAKSRFVVVTNEALTPFILCDNFLIKHERGPRSEFWISDFAWTAEIKKTPAHSCRMLGLARENGPVVAISAPFKILFTPEPTPQRDSHFMFGRLH